MIHPSIIIRIPKVCFGCPCFKALAAYSPLEEGVVNPRVDFGVRRLDFRGMAAMKARVLLAHIANQLADGYIVADANTRVEVVVVCIAERECVFCLR